MEFRYVGRTPKSSILIGFSILNHPFWGTIIFGNTYIYINLIIHICKAADLSISGKCILVY